VQFVCLCVTNCTLDGDRGAWALTTVRCRWGYDRESAPRRARPARGQGSRPIAGRHDQAPVDAIDSGAWDASTGAGEEIVMALDLEQARRRATRGPARTPGRGPGRAVARRGRAWRGGRGRAPARRELDAAGRRVEGYVAAARRLIAAGASVSAGMAEVASDDVAVLLEDVEPRDERLFEIGQVLVRVRCRGGRCEIDDRGWAVEVSGRAPGWLEAAERTVAELGWNVARTGTVFVAAAADRDIDDLVRRTADAALAVRDAILDL
jgi:hypothetical protein